MNPERRDRPLLLRAGHRAAAASHDAVALTAHRGGGRWPVPCPLMGGPGRGRRRHSPARSLLVLVVLSAKLERPASLGYLVDPRDSRGLRPRCQSHWHCLRQCGSTRIVGHDRRRAHRAHLRISGTLGGLSRLAGVVEYRSIGYRAAWSMQTGLRAIRKLLAFLSRTTRLSRSQKVPRRTVFHR